MIAGTIPFLNDGEVFLKSCPMKLDSEADVLSHVPGIDVQACQDMWL